MFFHSGLPRCGSPARGLLATKWLASFILRDDHRIVFWINYPYRVVYVRFIGTHRQYDAIDAQTI
jgi:mRNA-degrading endonuclease HigB of HigAB toxin-antitoxin module